MTHEQTADFIDEMSNGLLPAYGYLQMALQKGAMPLEDIAMAAKSCERCVEAIREMRRAMNAEAAK